MQSLSNRLFQSSIPNREEGLFRCAGDIVYDENTPFPGQISDVQLKQYSETSNFLQCLDPLTPEFPYFFGQIRALCE